MLLRKGMILILITLLIMLTGCGGASTTNQEEADSNQGGTNSQQETYTFKLAGYHPTTSPVSTEYIEVFIKRVEELSNGKVKIEYFPAEQMGKASALLDLVKNGTVDMANISPAYYSDRLPLNSVTDLPNIYSSVEEGVQILWNLMGGELGKEFTNQGLRPLATSTTLPYPLFMVDKKVTTLEDVKGLKVRVAGATAEITVNKLGATPVKVSAPEQYSAFERGVLNAGMLALTSFPTYQLDDFIKYYINNIYLGGASNIITMNNKVYDKLPEDIKTAMEQASKEAMENFAQKEDESLLKYKKEYTENNAIEFYDLSEEQLVVWNEIFAEVEKEWVGNMEKFGINSAQVVLDKAKQERDNLRK